jgi:hypothetical protein
LWQDQAVSFHIIDRENRRFVADVDTREEAEQRLAELLEVNPDADLFIFSAGEDDPTEPVVSDPAHPETRLIVQPPEPELLEQVDRVRDTEA